jgi:isopentenyl phosphate kinase
MNLFLKLGGSLITDKDKAHSARLEVIHRIADEIKTALEKNDGLNLLLAHGSGSFGHMPAKKYGTRDGVKNPDDWRGFLEVWREAHCLNQILLDVFSSHQLPVLSFPPSSMITAQNKILYKWNLSPIKSALDAKLIPIVFGDVIFDLICGGTIFSTEELFIPLVDHLSPERILIAGIEEGVWQDYPKCHKLLKNITQETDPEILKRLGTSRSIDVTGGMLEKVNLMRTLTSGHPELIVNIFSGLIPNNILRSLNGEDIGTSIRCR